MTRQTIIRPVILFFGLLLTGFAASAGNIPDAPLEPNYSQSDEAKAVPGSILEFWFAPPGKRFERFPTDPSVTGMIDAADKVFQGSSMLNDPEMKNFIARHGVLQWTTYFRVNKPGKHVFAMGIDGMWSDNPSYGGASMLVNGESKLTAIPKRDESATVDFAKPGLYKLQIRMWWTHGGAPTREPLFQDYRVGLKVREPGSLGLRQVTKKDLFLLPQ